MAAPDAAGQPTDTVGGLTRRWKDYVEAIVKPEGIPVLEVRVPTERKTGLLRASGTTRVVRITERDRILVEVARGA